MTNIYSAIQLRHLYQEVTMRMGLSTQDIIERSAQGFANLFGQYYRLSELHLFAGPELNGAITLAIARILLERHYSVKVYLFYMQGNISEEAEIERQKFIEQGGSIVEVSNKFSPPQLKSNCIIIDGLWGYELVAKLEGGFAALVKWINSQDCEVVSVDLPSGLFADDNSHNHLASIIKANRTISFESPRLSMFLAEHRERVGSWHIVPLGISPELHEDKICYHRCINEAMLAPLLSPRKSFSQHNDYGPALLAVGSEGSPGIIANVARAISLVGCSAVHIYAEPRMHTALEVLAPDARVLDAGEGTKQLYNPHSLRAYKAIGIGLAHGPESLEHDMLLNLFSSYRKPIVLDGYAIELLVDYPSLLDHIPENSILILDHEKRERLLGIAYSDYEYLDEAQSFASKNKVTLILCGTYTTVVRSSGTIYFSLSGNEGMRKDGINDLLSGCIVGLMARGYDTLTAALLACHLWGTAADDYVGRYSAECLSPKVILDEFPAVWKQLES